MKLAFLLFDYFPVGGLQRDCLSIAERCAANGHDVTILTRTWQGDRPQRAAVQLFGRRGWTNVGRNRAWLQQLEAELGVVLFDRLSDGLRPTSAGKAVIEAASAYGRAFPMMMTAAGTISPAKVFVMGVGVAGLQAIATAKRLGAQVSATDVRSATREQILSLGAKPIFVETVSGIEGEGKGGYATEMSDEYRKAQAELVSSHIAKQDIVVTTALIPGKPAPRLITDAQVATMRPGSVIVDLAADSGGNVEGALPDQRVDKHGVTIIGASKLARSLAADSSALFARNLFNFLSAFWDKDKNSPELADEDEIVAAIRLTTDGKVVSDRLAGA